MAQSYVMTMWLLASSTSSKVPSIFTSSGESCSNARSTGHLLVKVPYTPGQGSAQPLVNLLVSSIVIGPFPGQQLGLCDCFTHWG